MKVIPALLLVLTLFDKSHTNATDPKISCSDLKDLVFIGRVFISLSSTKKNSDIGVDFFLSTNERKDHVSISIYDWAGLETNSFNPLKKTYIIIHGYKSGGTKSWVLALKDKLLDSVSKEKRIFFGFVLCNLYTLAS